MSSLEIVRLPKMTDNHPNPSLPSYTVAAPVRLVAATRLEFRRQALELVDRASNAGARAVAVDLSSTTEIDASGLGILVLLQKRGRERGMATHLLRPTEPVRRLLILTRLDYLFEFVH